MSVTHFDILLVDDNPGDVLLTRKAFATTNANNVLHVVNDGEAALDFLHQRRKHVDAPRPDLVLLDINLPRVSGHEVLSEIKESPELRRIPVVMLSGSNLPKDIGAAYDAHANSYISKPDDLPSLTDAIRRLQEYWFSLVKRPHD